MESKQFGTIGEKSSLIKLHGCLDDFESIVISINEIGRRCAFPKLNILKYFLENYWVLFLGYRGADLDIFNCLATTNCKGVIWNAFNEQSILPKIENLMKKCEGMYVFGDLSKILGEISSNLNLNKDYSKIIPKTGRRDFLQDFINWAAKINPLAKKVILGDLWRYIGEWDKAKDFFYSGYNSSKNSTDKTTENLFLGRLAGLFYKIAKYDDAKNICNIILDNAKQLSLESALYEYAHTLQLIGLIEGKKDIKKSFHYFVESLKCQEELEKINPKNKYKKGGDI